MKKKYQVSLVLITVMLLGAIALATSYALWTVNKTQTGTNIVETGCFSIELSNESGQINLSNAYPITDAESESLTPYTFTVTNTCTIDAKYSMNLEILPTSTLDVQYLAASINNGNVIRLRNTGVTSPTITDVTESRVLEIGTIEAGKTKDFEIRLWVDESVTIEDVEEMNKILNSKVVIVSAATEIPKPAPICKRADVTTLHSETCTNTYGGCRDSIGIGETVTYGNTTVTSGVLNTGDAFDCDVDGTGYNHRFYYLSDLYTGGEEESETWDEDTAVLVYYNNVKIEDNKVIASNSSSNAYGSYSNYNGPTTAISYIPTKEQWPKMSISEDRQLRSEKGTTTTESGSIISFDGYQDKASRFLTTQEINKGCGLTSSTMGTTFALDTEKCRFLVENTVYALFETSALVGYWVETPPYSILGSGWYVNGAFVSLKDYDTNALMFGVRPVIEVAKSNISY